MSLLENIVFKSQKINFDLSKSLNSNLIKENVNVTNNQFQNTPIRPAKGEWIEEDNLLRCSFTFKNERHVIFFVNQILEKAIKVRHHPEIYIDHKNVVISLSTKDLNQITDLDLQMARFITDIYDDTQFIMDI